MARFTLPLIARALLLGIGGGFRSLSPFAALALKYGSSNKGGWRKWYTFRSKRERGMMIAFAAVEYVSDKVPWAQSRLAIGIQPSTGDTGLIGRVALVTVAGAALGSEYERQDAVVAGAAFAAVGAIVGNYLGDYGRRTLTKATGLPDTAIALVEDAAAIGLLAVAVQTEP